jgi:hypothetical protein
MKALTSMLIAAVVSTSLAGCIVRTRDRHHHHHHHNAKKKCAPGYHWERGACVHNGHGKHRR